MKKSPKNLRNKSMCRILLPTVLIVCTLLVLTLRECRPLIPPMDDTYIHLVFGRSLFSGNPLCFNQAEISSGFTSPVWLLPSALASISGTEAAPVILMGFSLIAAALALLAAGPWTGLLLLMTGPFFFHASSGMETALASLFVIVLWKSVRDETMLGLRPFILAGAFLCRPELAILAVPLIFAIRGRSARNILILLAPSFIVGILWIIWNLHAAGMLLPSTFYAKQPVSWFSSAASGLPGLLKNILLVSPLLIFAATASIIELFKTAPSDVRRKNIALGSFPVLLFATSLLLQPNSFFQMRYYVPALTAAVLVAGHWLSGLHRKKLNTALLAASMLPGLLIFGGRRTEASYDVGAIDVDPADYLAAGATDTETVASADIGAVKWITDMHILDLDGLVTPERLPGKDTEGWYWIEQNADYLLAFPKQYSNLVSEAGESIEFLAGFGSRSNVICGEDSVTLWKIL
ncbi:MAG: hypothetical protein KAW14_03895 [Candidatus Aegiribacteria sp.]|nr:hypothetical protein [Candidatus Aegiribacteria sp.]